MASQGLARHTVLYVALLLGMLSLGCATVSFISPYDESTDRDITALKTQVDSLIIKLGQEPMPERAQLNANYAALHTRLRGVIFRNEARPKNALTVQQLGEFQAELDTLDALHTTRRLNGAMVEPAGNIMSQTLRAILTLELNKKELKKPE